MTFYMLAGKAATVFLSLNIVTVLTFNAPVKTVVYGGSKDELFIQKANDDKTLIIKPLTENLKSNFLVITQDHQYDFYLAEGKPPHDFVEIADGKKDSVFIIRLETKDYQLWEGKTSLRFVNRGNKDLMVNGEVLRGVTYLNKGAPVFVGTDRVFN